MVSYNLVEMPANLEATMKHCQRPEEQDDLPRPQLIDMRHELSALIDGLFFETYWAEFFPSTTWRPVTSPLLVAGLMYLQQRNARKLVMPGGGRHSSAGAF